MPKTAIVVGATGLVGGELVGQLLERGWNVLAFTRRPVEPAREGLTSAVVDLADVPSFAARLRGDALFSALGTTRARAGSDEARRAVDYTMQLEIARAAADGGVPAYALVSSAGASERSASFYLRMRGELERAVETLPFARARILRPGLLAGERAEKRRAEAAAIAVMRWVGKLPGLGGTRPIPATDVARALIAAAEDPTPGVKIYGPEEVFSLGASPR
jgi:uncharacterized protein YbjT (DUF2867 family)